MEIPRRVGGFVTNKVLGIDTKERYSRQPLDLGKRADEILQPADIYLEEEPSVAEWFTGLVPTTSGVCDYFKSLFPATSWLPRYCGNWLIGDLISGITVGLVVVPQGLAYASLAGLSPGYGLYTSFTGAVTYWLFGTSKDIVIGATAVGSLFVGHVIASVEDLPSDYEPEEVAHTLSMLVGLIMLGIGFLRLGWIIEFVPYIPISAFISAASVTILSTQIPKALGLYGVNTTDSCYLVFGNIIKSLPKMHLDAAIGVSSIVLLYAIRDFCAWMQKRQPALKNMWACISSLRMSFVMILFTLISFLVNKDHPHNPKFKIVGEIESGFRKAGLPRLDPALMSAIIPQLPTIALVLVIEHIAISKAMGRQFNYIVNPSQEIVALGVANVSSCFLGGYVCTGSFGASAVLSKAGVRTPMAGVFSGAMVVLALYALTSVFKFIPTSALAGLIIHAVCNLLTSPQNLFKYWQLAPTELFIWVTCFLVAIFTNLENSIYCGVGLSILLLLARLARTKGHFLGHAQSRRVAAEGCHVESQSVTNTVSRDGEILEREVFLPLNRTEPEEASNPRVKVERPYPGVIVYRLKQGLNYTNQAFHMDIIMDYIENNTRRTAEETFENPSDKPWNYTEPKTPVKGEGHEDLPLLRALVLDFATVNIVDITAVQGLIDFRNTLERYCAPEAVEIHFANINNRWARRALAVSGFGYPSSKNKSGLDSWQPVYSIAPVLDSDVGHEETRKQADIEKNESEQRSRRTSADGSTLALDESNERAGMAAIYGVNRPFFHYDLYDAVNAAVRGAKAKDAIAGLNLNHP